MNTKVIFVAIVIGVVLAGGSIAFAKQTSWQAPTKPFPDLGGIAAPLDEGGGTQSRAGIIDFSSAPFNPLQFSSGQGIFSSGAFNIFSGDFKIATLGNGLVFPDGTKQTTAGGDIFTLGKLCKAVNSASTNTINAPDSWMASDCNTFASSLGATGYQLGCALSSGVSFGVTGGGLPAQNCGWSGGASGGLYYPYAPAGNPSPQKVISGANQPSVPSGFSSVSVTPKMAIPTACVGNNPAPYCQGLTGCKAPESKYAISYACGAYIYDNAINRSGDLCGTGSAYQVYCR